MGVEHYENFPVASLLLPAPLRAPVQAIYRYARAADDVADEGDAPDAVRLADLARLRAVLDGIDAGAPAPHDWADLADALRRHRLPTQPLRDLLSAFEQDVRVKRYADYGELLDYCRRSANPVGRLLLALLLPAQMQADDRRQLLDWSDAICTGLQLVNFWQDVGIDWTKGRVYIPRTEFERHGVDESAIAGQRVDERWRRLLAAQTARARALLAAGTALPLRLGGRFGWELRLVVQGGLLIAQKIDDAGGDVFRRRPVLGKLDWMRLAARAARMR